MMTSLPGLMGGIVRLSSSFVLLEAKKSMLRVRDP